MKRLQWALKPFMFGAILLMVASGCEVYSQNVPSSGCNPGSHVSGDSCEQNPPCLNGGTYPFCKTAPTCTFGGIFPNCKPQPTPTPNLPPDGGGSGGGGGGGYGPGGADEAITPEIAQQLFKAAGLSPGDIPGVNGTISQRPVNLADVAGQQPGAAAELSKDGAVQGYEQSFYTGAFGGVVTEFAVFNTAEGAASWLTYLTNAPLPLGQSIASANGLSMTPQKSHSIDIASVGDQSAGIEITGTWGQGSLQDQPFVVDVGLARRGLVQYAVAVERTSSAGDILTALNGDFKTLDGKVATAITSLNLAAPSGPSASYPAGWVLVSGPGGTTFGAAQGSLYTFQAGDAAYETVNPNSGVAAGEGYWAYFNGPATVALAGQSTVNAAIQAPAGAWVMIGNPSATDTLTVNGADTVLIYDPAGGQYSAATSLKPGQGAWAMSLDGGMITIGP
ncbi:MAG: hypothetical protein ACYDCQ_00390 [Dehalococcoidia bacterium]